jgi:hypothetical protein
MASILQLLKPTDEEIRALALKETDPAQVERFEPIARGPLFAAVGIVLVLCAALPGCMLRLLRGLRRAR